MTRKSVAAKAHIEPGTAIAVVTPAPGVVESLGLPSDVSFVKVADAQLVFVFANTRAELDAHMPPAAEALTSGAALWVFFRRGSKAAGLDMNRNSIWEIAERFDLRPRGLLSVDDTWSVFRLKPAE